MIYPHTPIGLRLNMQTRLAPPRLCLREEKRASQPKSGTLVLNLTNRALTGNEDTFYKKEKTKKHLYQ